MKLLLLILSLIVAGNAWGADGALSSLNGTTTIGATANGAVAQNAGTLTNGYIQGSSIKNLFLGDATGRATTTGSNNYAAGCFAFTNNTTGWRNVAVGVAALVSNLTGYYNVAVGHGAMASNISGFHNVAIGGDALGFSISAQQDVAVGVDALLNNTTGSKNTAIGAGAMTLNLIGEDNTAVGNGSLFAATASENSAVGINSGLALTSGTYNTFIGAYAGSDAAQKVDAVKSTSIGSGSYNTKSHQVVIGNTEVTETLLQGNVGISHVNPDKLLIVGAVTDSVVQGYDGIIANIAGNAQISARSSDADVEVGMFAHGNGNGYIGTWSSSPLVFRAANSDAMVLSTAGGLAIGPATPAAKLDVGGDIRASTTIAATNGFIVPNVSNARAGNLTLIGGTKTVSNTSVTANTLVILTRKTSGGTIGTAITYTVSAATSFTVNSDNILDTSTFSYLLIENP